MTPAAKSLILKAEEHLQTAKSHIDDDGQHDVVGYNLGQACECYLKALCVMRNLEFPEDGHDLDALMQTLEEDNLQAISSHADVVELTQYNRHNAHIRKEQRLDLYEYLGRVEDLKVLFK